MFPSPVLPCTCVDVTSWPTIGASAPRATGTSARPASSTSCRALRSPRVDVDVTRYDGDGFDTQLGRRKREEYREGIICARVDVEQDRLRLCSSNASCKSHKKSGFSRNRISVWVKF